MLAFVYKNLLSNDLIYLFIILFTIIIGIDKQNVTLFRFGIFLMKLTIVKQTYQILNEDRGYLCVFHHSMGCSR